MLVKDLFSRMYGIKPNYTFIHDPDSNDVVSYYSASKELLDSKVKRFWISTGSDGALTCTIYIMD